MPPHVPLPTPIGTHPKVLVSPLRTRGCNPGAGYVSAKAGPRPLEPADDATAVALRSALDRITPALAVAARRFMAIRAWVPFGYARLEDHARERFGRSGRWLRDLAVLGDALERLPRLAAALSARDGGRALGYVAALLIGRLASPESVGAWVELARRLPIREFKAAVRKARQAESAWPIADDGAAGARPGSLQDGSHPGDSAVGASSMGEQDLEDRRRVGLRVPEPIRVAFTETFALHRAVCGREGGVASFIDALIGEALAGDHAFDPDELADVVEPGQRRQRDALESALFRETSQWRHLDDAARRGAQPTPETLTWTEHLIAGAGSGGPADLDEQIRALVALDERLKSRLGRLLLAMGRERGWSRLRFAGLGHYAEQRLGMSRSAAAERVRLARGLTELPRVARAYAGARLGFEAALLVVRVLGRGPVDPEQERAWVAHAERATIKRLRDETRALERRRLERPRAAPPPPPMGDAEWYASLRQRPGEIRARLRECGIRAACPTGPDVFLSLSLPADLAAGFVAAVEAARRVVAAAAGMGARDAEIAGQGSVARQAARLFSSRGLRVPQWIGLLAMLEDFVETWDDPAGMPRRRSDRVYEREGWRCAAPGCTSRRNLEDHHVVYRSRGGSKHGLFNRICLCRFHHLRGEHGALASCRGVAPLGLLWRLGREDLGSWFRNECRVARRGTSSPGLW